MTSAVGIPSEGSSVETARWGREHRDQQHERNR